MNFQTINIKKLEIMETGIFEIELNDGRTFRVFYANSTQKKKILNSYNRIKSNCKELRTITNGIHTVRQWEKIAELI